MSLSEDQTKWLETFFIMCENNPSKLSTWETSFVNDQKTRYDEYGTDIRLSPKQWNVLNKIDAKLNGQA